MRRGGGRGRAWSLGSLSPLAQGTGQSDPAHTSIQHPAQSSWLERHPPLLTQGPSSWEACSHASWASLTPPPTAYPGPTASMGPSVQRGSPGGSGGGGTSISPAAAGQQPGQRAIPSPPTASLGPPSFRNQWGLLSLALLEAWSAGRQSPQCPARSLVPLPAKAASGRVA